MHSAAAFVMGFASHFALDAIPHVPIKSGSVNPRIGASMAFDGAPDGLFGIIIALFLFSSSASFLAILMGAIGAILPDPLQFVHSRLPHEPLRINVEVREAQLRRKSGSVDGFLDRQLASQPDAQIKPP